MFSLPELEAALALVHESFPGTPQYAWPLLSERRKKKKKKKKKS
jgi:hypothetical protein